MEKLSFANVPVVYFACLAILVGVGWAVIRRYCKRSRQVARPVSKEVPKLQTRKVCVPTGVEPISVFRAVGGDKCEKVGGVIWEMDKDNRHCVSIDLGHGDVCFVVGKDNREPGHVLRILVFLQGGDEAVLECHALSGVDAHVDGSLSKAIAEVEREGYHDGSARKSLPSAVFMAWRNRLVDVGKAFRERPASGGTVGRSVSATDRATPVA